MWDECAIADDNRFDRLICRRIIERLREVDSSVEFDSSEPFLSNLLDANSKGKEILVFPDINMPGMNGLDLLQRLNEGENYRELIERLSISS